MVGGRAAEVDEEGPRLCCEHLELSWVEAMTHGERTLTLSPSVPGLWLLWLLQGWQISPEGGRAPRHWGLRSPARMWLRGGRGSPPGAQCVLPENVRPPGAPVWDAPAVSGLFSWRACRPFTRERGSRRSVSLCEPSLKTGGA